MPPSDADIGAGHEGPTKAHGCAPRRRMGAFIFELVGKITTEQFQLLTFDPVLSVGQAVALEKPISAALLFTITETFVSLNYFALFLSRFSSVRKS